MSCYVTVKGESLVYNGRVFSVGMKLELIVPKRMGWRDVKDLNVGEQCIVRNIVYPTNSPVDVYLACEYDRHINGHNCAADRSGMPPWEPRYLCKHGHGDWMNLKEAFRTTREVNTNPDWEV